MCIHDMYVHAGVFACYVIHLYGTCTFTCKCMSFLTEKANDLRV